MERYSTIYDFLTAEEVSYARPIQVIENWDWSMNEHIKLTILYKNSTYSTGKDDNKPFKNVIRPILNLQYRAEGFDVKDIELYVEEKDNFYKSFLVKKYHQRWARENALDTFIDDLVESYVDFGGSLVKKIDKAVPEVVPMQSIAFVDQTDILSGPICLKHFFSPEQLKNMEDVGWGDEKNGATISIDDLIELSENSENGKVKDKQDGRKTKTPGKYIEIYELHGCLPTQFLSDDSDYNEKRDYTNQFQIVAFYHNKDGKQGITLYRKEEKESPFKLILRDKIYGRALGLGGAEELFEAQVWTNYDIIRIKGMLDTASKILLRTDDPSFAHRNNINNLDNGEILVTDDNKTLTQIDTFPRNISLFEKSIAEWESHARTMGSAQEAILGEQAPSGTPFRSVELQASESHSLHEYRKGKLATFVDEIYQDWIIPYISKEVVKDQDFLAELDLKEMQEVVQAVKENTANREKNRLVLSGEMIDESSITALKDKTANEFMKSNKKFLEIFSGEMKDAPLMVKVNVSGKQAHLSKNVDKLTNIFRQIIGAPQMLANPVMNDLFNQIIEASGFSPLDFSGLANIASPQMPQQLTAAMPAQV